jgi:alpha-N-acetylgalactosaminidase
MLGAVLVLCCVALSNAANNGLALTPPRGWLAWGTFRCQIDCNTDPDNCIGEGLFRSMADRMSEDGWVSLGYNYLNIDDW